ncbi:MFS transporter [Rubinisphaera sp. JC750]|uniref:MFS transporter n=1 Tax=Rubinisphaera sp. JC750 TaxID=2898658 RepID=UPI001F012078|nr:MFS transporter [Rubinisphaera sp. JC750]
MSNSAGETETADVAWYSGISRYQWLVLVIACAGWIFDVYEGQIFNITRSDMLLEILDGDEAAVKRYGDYFLGIFLAGGTFGGLLFGSLADRFGRRPTMVATILMYSLFSGLTFFAQELWHVAALRFLVAMGVGGEWAVAASLVSEVFPTRARAQASAIFHGSSVLGTWLAAIAGIVVGSEWRYAYLIGVLPALLILWVRASVKETDTWKTSKAAEKDVQPGSFRDLLFNAQWARRALLGMALAAVGLGTFWSVTVAGQNLAELRLEADGVSADLIDAKSKFAYGIVQTTGGGLGLIAFGMLCQKFGRKPTFIGYHVLALAIVPIVCFVPQSYTQLLLLLPIFGFLTLGIHAGYAVYFPELFPTRLRATGTSFCFNGGRLAAVPILLYSGDLKGSGDVSLPWAVTGLSLLFLLGIVIVCFLPETKGRELPE